MYVDVQRTSLCRVLPTTSLPTLGFKPHLFTRHLQPGRSLAVCLFLLVLLCSGPLLPVVAQLMPPSFYPFRREAGDNVTASLDDGGSGRIDLLQPFPFFGKLYNKLFVNNNGVITFLKELKTYRPADFPLDEAPLNETPLIAPYWADVDVNVGGQVYYRQTQDPAILERASKDVHMYSPAYHKFRATWVFIATWDRVGYYGATNDGVNKKNTFQCVLVSNRIQSFVMTNYAEIEWTTGSNSHGTPDTGLGGNPAQAGFNAGDGINYYEIEGAGTDSVINLTRTSNVCIPGRWIFRVDLQQIVGDSGNLCMTPASGSMLGGYEVAVTCPCLGQDFGGTTTVQGLLVEVNTTFPCVNSANDSSIRTVYCVMPTVFRLGRMTVSILLDGQRWNYTTSFTFVNPGLEDAKIVRHSPKTWRAGQGSVSVSWDSALFPSNQSHTLEVLAYRDSGEKPELVVESSETATTSNNGGKTLLRLPALVNATLAVIRVKVPHPLINGSYLSHWSDVFPVRWRGQDQSAAWCSDWLAAEQSRPPVVQREACPCTLQQAESDTGRWQRDPLCSSAHSSRDYNCIYRGSKTHECIVPSYTGSRTITQRCCYDRRGELLDVQEGGGGSMVERYHFQSGSQGEEEWGPGDLVVPWFSYLAEDVATFLHCCQYSDITYLCQGFQGVRPPTSCQGYTPPAAAQAAGDPHIVTLDGVNYTFNGEGDFVLLQDTTETVRVHVHADRAVDIDGQLGNATLFTAVAMSVVNETDVVEIRKDSEELVAVLVNQQEVEITSTQTQLRGMTVYQNQTGNGTVEFTVVLAPAGLSVLVSVTPDLLNIMVLIGSSQLKGNLTGLLGNYNGEMEDDLKPRYGDPIPITANMSQVHYLFGMTWYLAANETLLYHPDTAFQLGDQAGSSGTDIDYVPEFLGSTQERELRNGTAELCQGNEQCIFDFQLTGKESIGQATKQFSDRFENVRKEIAPVVRCPYVYHIANGNRTVEGYKVGDKVYFTCDSGFKAINGSTALRCLQTGTWDGTAPDCVKQILSPEMTDTLLLIISISSAVGGFVVVIVAIVLLRCAVRRCRRKYVPKPATDAGSEADQGLELHDIFPPSETPNPVFENPLFLTQLQKLRSEEGRFQIPRPRYVDPNIYTEYF
ncbi:sushi domain-containing protein 2-like [Babylonia areolata]|uniref:sushi domain-containing protein 2-like n=1 Tax=Babylonia areolata TaxID=304850 RepID=UPI003FD4C923